MKRKTYRRRRRSELDLVALLMARLRTRLDSTFDRQAVLFLDMARTALLHVRKNVRAANHQVGRPVVLTSTKRSSRKRRPTRGTRPVGSVSTVKH